MPQINSVYLVVDSDGSFVSTAGDWQSDQPFSRIRAANYPLNTGFDGIVNLPGSSYFIEPDSTGEIYVQFLARDDTPESNVILLCRGNRINIGAAKIKVIGIRRSGVVKITAAVTGQGAEIFGNIAASGESVSFRFPDVDFLAPTPGWTVFRPQIADNWIEAPYLAVKTGQEIGFAGELGGSARRFGNGTFTTANFTTLAYGFADVQNGVLVKWWPYYELVTNSAVSGGTYATVAQSYWHPAVLGYRSSAGVAAGTSTVPQIRLMGVLNYPYLRDPSKLAQSFA